MSYYLFQGRYSTEAFKAKIDNPQDREGPGRALIESVGGKLHNIFFCLGTDDVIALVEAPDDEAMAAAAMTLAASGAFSGGHTTKLITAKDAVKSMKLAQKAAAAYKPATA